MTIVSIMTLALPNRSVSMPKTVPPMPHANNLAATIRPPMEATSPRAVVRNRSPTLGASSRVKTLSAIESNIQARNAERTTSATPCRTVSRCRASPTTAHSSSLLVGSPSRSGDTAGSFLPVPWELPPEVVQDGQVVFRQPDLRGSQQRWQLSRLAGADQDGGDVWLMHDPSDRRGRHVVPPLRAEATISLNGIEVAGRPIPAAVALAHGDAPGAQPRVPEATARGCLLTQPVPSGQEPRRQRVVGEHPHPEPRRHGERLHLGIPPEQVVPYLHRDRGHEPPALSGPQGLHHPPGRPVAHPHIANLAVLDQAVERVERLLDRASVVELMGLIQVDVLHAQASQARVDGVEKVLSTQAPPVGPGADRVVDLGRDRQVVAAPPGRHPPSEDPLRLPEQARLGGIAVARVDEPDPGVVGEVEDLVGGVLGRPIPEGRRPEADPRHLEAVPTDRDDIALPARRSEPRRLRHLRSSTITIGHGVPKEPMGCSTI